MIPLIVSASPVMPINQENFYIIGFYLQHKASFDSYDIATPLMHLNSLHTKDKTLDLFQKILAHAYEQNPEVLQIASASLTDLYERLNELLVGIRPQVSPCLLKRNLTEKPFEKEFLKEVSPLSLEGLVYYLTHPARKEIQQGLVQQNLIPLLMELFEAIPQCSPFKIANRPLIRLEALDQTLEKIYPQEGDPLLLSFQMGAAILKAFADLASRFRPYCS